MAFSVTEKTRYWVAVCYPENMVDDWQIKIGDLLGLPYSYCIHDKDHLGGYVPKKNDIDYDRLMQRKVHVHIIIAFPNTTTYKNALRVFDCLSVPGVHCVNTCLPINNIRNMYDYIIHNTETAKKQQKYLYPESERINGNNFDIGCYEQIGQEEKQALIKEIGYEIVKEGFTNYTDLFLYASSNYDSIKYSVFISYKQIFAEITKGTYLKKSGKLNFDDDKELISNDTKRA